MRHNSNTIIKRLVQYGVLLLSIVFLSYKLSHITHWETLKNSLLNMGARETMTMVLIVLLMPFNWFLESKKWQVILSNNYPIGLRQALRSVLLGLHTGYITPNRVGEFAGRIAFLPASFRWSGIVLHTISSITQNVVITLAGLIASIYYFSHYQTLHSEVVVFFIYTLSILFLLALLLGGVPYWVKRQRRSRWGMRAKRIILSLSNTTYQTLCIALLLSVLRYIVFGVQFSLMLHFWGIEIGWQEALVGIPTMYLLITYTPSFSFSEPMVRSSYAVWIMGAFTDNEIGTILSGVAIWLINFVIPLLIGGGWLLYNKPKK